MTIISLFRPGGSSAILLGVLQKLTSYIKYLKLPYSARLKEMLLAWQSNIFAFDIYPALPSNLMAYLVSKPIPEIFIEHGVDPSFLVNFWKTLIALISVFLSWILLKLIIKFTRPKNGASKLHSFLNIFQLMLFKFLIIGLYSSYGDVTMFFALEVRSVTHEYFLSSVSFGICIAFMSLTIFFSCFHAWFVIAYQKLKKAQASGRSNKDPNTFLKKYSNLSVLYFGFKDESFSQQAIFCSSTFETLP